MVKKQLEHVGKILNVNFIFRGGDVDAAGQTAYVENLIAAGVDGILMCPIVDSSIERFVTLCEEAKVPIAFMFRGIEDPASRAKAMSSPYFVGYVVEGEEEAGADLVDAIVEAGSKNLGFLYLEPGSIVNDRRQAGMTARAEEIGVNVVATHVMPMGALASHFTEGANSILTAFPECDGFLLSFGSDGGIDAVVQLIRSRNLEGKVRVATFDSVQDATTAFGSNILVAQTAGSKADALFAFMMLYNYVQGAPLSNEKIELNCNYVYIRNLEEAALYDQYWAGDEYLIYSEEEIKNMTKFYNPNLTLDQFEKIVADYGYEDVLSRRGVK